MFFNHSRRSVLLSNGYVVNLEYNPFYKLLDLVNHLEATESLIQYPVFVNGKIFISAIGKIYRVHLDGRFQASYYYPSYSIIYSYKTKSTPLITYGQNYLYVGEDKVSIYEQPGKFLFPIVFDDFLGFIIFDLIEENEGYYLNGIVLDVIGKPAIKILDVDSWRTTHVAFVLIHNKRKQHYYFDDIFGFSRIYEKLDPYIRYVLFFDIDSMQVYEGTSLFEAIAPLRVKETEKVAGRVRDVKWFDVR